MEMLWSRLHLSVECTWKIKRISALPDDISCNRKTRLSRWSEVRWTQSRESLARCATGLSWQGQCRWVSPRRTISAATEINLKRVNRHPHLITCGSVPSCSTAHGHRWSRTTPRARGSSIHRTTSSSRGTDLGLFHRHQSPVCTP